MFLVRSTSEVSVRCKTGNYGQSDVIPSRQLRRVDALYNQTANSKVVVTSHGVLSLYRTTPINSIWPARMKQSGGSMPFTVQCKRCKDQADHLLRLAH